MIVFRSLLFNLFLYGWTAFIAITCLPLILFPRRYFARVLQTWSGWVITNLRVLCGITLEVRGRENIPEGRALIACKHQSMWETTVFFALVKDPVIVLKKELTYIPLYGWLVMKSAMIYVDRSAHARALRSLIAQAKARLKEPRPILIFPEGSRTQPGRPGNYKPGVAALYTQLGLPCVPVALNSGLVWPLRKFLRRPGKIIVEFLEPIPPGLKRKDFMAILESRIETASQKLYEEGLQALESAAPRPTPPGPQGAEKTAKP